MPELHYIARPQMIAFHGRTQKRAVLVTHRRFGKTRGILEDFRMAMLTSTRHRPHFSYVAPTIRQAKDIAWPYVEDLFETQLPGCVLNRSELTATLPHNNARLRLYGVENADAMRGGYNDGVACDEYGDFPPEVWPYVLRPTLLDRDGWAVFTGTPKGRTALWTAWRVACENPETWFRLMVRASESGLIDQKVLDEIRQEIGDDAFNQEFECSFDAPIIGSYYGKLLNDAEAEGRLWGDFELHPEVPFFTAWDLGVDDRTAIWVWQPVPTARGTEVLVHDYYEGRGYGLDHYVNYLKDNWSPGALRDYVPHDARVKEFGSGKTRVETMREKGLHPQIVSWVGNNKGWVADGIQAARNLLPRCHFHKRCATGVDRLGKYVAGPTGPVHDEDGNSDAADAFRYLAVAQRGVKPKPKPEAKQDPLTFDREAYTIGPPTELPTDEFGPSNWRL